MRPDLCQLESSCLGAGFIRINVSFIDTFDGLFIIPPCKLARIIILRSFYYFVCYRGLFSTAFRPLSGWINYALMRNKLFLGFLLSPFRFSAVSYCAAYKLPWMLRNGQTTAFCLIAGCV